MGLLQVGFANIEIIPFSDENFTLNPAQLIKITPDDIDSADEITVTKAKDITTVVRGSGRKEIFENPNPESGILNLTLLNEIADRLVEFIFPDAVVTIDGQKKKVEFFDSPALLYTKFDKMFKVIIKPLLEDKTESPPKDWLTMPRAVITPAQTDSFSSVPGKTELNIITIGGLDTGSPGIAQGDVDISTTIDLSSGGTDKLIDVTIDGSPQININFGQSAATTTAQILDAINTAFGTIVAGIDTDDFLRITGFQPGGNVTVDDPTAGASAAALVYQSGGSFPDSNDGTAQVNIPTFIDGDETAA